MIIIRLMGGLGNQMFQYAFGYAMARKKSEILMLDITGFDSDPLRKFALNLFKAETIIASKKEIENVKFEPEGFIKKIIRYALKRPRELSQSYYHEPHFHYDSIVWNLNGDLYLEGYWQSEKYFIEFRKELLEQFKLKKPLHNDTKAFKKEIEKTSSISIHVRRGDFVSNPKTYNFHGICSLAYYNNAVSIIEKKVKNPCFYIFSDDHSWVKKHLGFIERKLFVELSGDTPDHEEMYLMSRCKHNIIANSSFSWWGAWLNQNPGKIVIAPKKWFRDLHVDTKDLLPKGWMAL